MSREAIIEDGLQGFLKIHLHVDLVFVCIEIRGKIFALKVVCCC